VTAAPDYAADLSAELRAVDADPPLSRANAVQAAMEDIASRAIGSLRVREAALRESDLSADELYGALDALVEAAEVAYKCGRLTDPAAYVAARNVLAKHGKKE
jgi:hypothetical protein